MYPNESEQTGTHRSEEWEQLVRKYEKRKLRKYERCKPSDGSRKFIDEELASSGLVLEFRSYQMVTQAILDKNAQLAFHVAKSNITDVYF